MNRKERRAALALSKEVENRAPNVISKCVDYLKALTDEMANDVTGGKGDGDNDLLYMMVADAVLGEIEKETGLERRDGKQ